MPRIVYLTYLIVPSVGIQRSWYRLLFRDVHFDLRYFTSGENRLLRMAGLDTPHSEAEPRPHSRVAAAQTESSQVSGAKAAVDKSHQQYTRCRQHDSALETKRC